MSFVVVPFGFVACAYWMRTGRSVTARGGAVLLSAVAAWAAYDGVMLAVREYDSAQHGRVQAGACGGDGG